MNWVANKIHYVVACLCQRGWNCRNNWMDSEKYSCIIGSIYVLCKYLYSCHIWNFEYTKTVTLHCSKSGRWYWPRSCNWGKPFWVKLTSQASSLAFVSRYKIFRHSWLIACYPNSKWQFPLHIIWLCGYYNFCTFWSRSYSSHTHILQLGHILHTHCHDSACEDHVT